MLLPLLAFVFGSLIVAGGALALMPSRGERDRPPARGADAGGVDADDERAKPRFERLVGFVKRVGEKAPRSPKEMGKLRLRLVQAGYRRDEALTIFFGIRVVFALALFALFSTSIVTQPNITLALGGLGARLHPAGHGAGAHGEAPRAPHPPVARRHARPARRQRRSRARPRPGAARASAQELAFAYPELSDELRLINLELRAGKPRVRSAAQPRRPHRRRRPRARSSTMLIQTDKFGTSVAQSLRVYSETLRTKRRQRAEEAAAKTGVKMVFPLVFCIFPAIWVVTIGPAAIKFVTVLFPLIEKHASRRRDDEIRMALIARNLDTGASSPTTSAVADTRATRAVGLLSRSGLEPGEALWIVPSRGVHTWWMRFTIDVVALDERGMVIDRVSRLKPWRIRLPRRGTAGVLELPAGDARRVRHRARPPDRARAAGGRSDECAALAAVEPAVADRRPADAAAAAGDDRGDRAAPRHAGAAAAEDAGRAARRAAPAWRRSCACRTRCSTR